MMKGKDYRMESNPKNAGEPTITAMVIIIPRATPTIMKRLFNIQNSFIPVKKEMN